MLEKLGMDEIGIKMSKIDTPNIIAECWQVLMEYIPEREQAAAAEHLITFFQAMLTKKEMLELTDLDVDLQKAFDDIAEPEEPEDDEEYETQYADND